MSSITSEDTEHNTVAPVGQARASTRQMARRSLLTGTVVGGIAALVASAVMLWAARSWGGVILAQLISDRMTGIIPVSLFGQALGALESNAKPLSVVMFTAAQVTVGAGIGAAYARVAARGQVSRLVGGTILSVLVLLVLAVVAAPLGQVGFVAVNAPGGAWPTIGIFVLTALTFGALAATFIPWPATAAEATDPSRRRVVQLAALSLPALAAVWYTGDFVQGLRRKGSASPSAINADEAASDPDAGPFAFAGMPHAITPTSEFYVVSKNVVDPTVDATGWQLEVSGTVERPLTLTYTDIITRPSVEFTSTLECISNSVGGRYISNAVWTGFPLASLLEEAGIQPGVVDIELHAADGYIESFPLAEGLAPDTMLVHSINGERLPDSHGFPARLIVPGIFGMKNVKWVEKIVAVDRDIQGFWQERGWSDIATVLTMSRFDTPRGGSDVRQGATVRIGGVAFAGDRGISAVEVSFDDGMTWQTSDLADELSPLAWRLWAIDFQPQTTGTHWLKVRATDGAGLPQTEEPQPPLPDGATGYHRIRLNVIEPDPEPTPSPTTPGN